MKTKVIAGVATLAVTSKLVKDVYDTRNPPAVLFRDGSIAKDVQLPWSDAFNLTGLYTWGLMGNRNKVINKILKDNTLKTEIKWNKDLTKVTKEERLKELEMFAALKQIPLEEGRWEKSLDKYATCDEFFARKYNPKYTFSPTKIFKKAHSEDVCSLAECKIVAYDTIEQSQRFWIKNKAFRMDQVGLWPNWQRYTGKSMCIFRLAPYDYHRYHSPVAGKIVYFEKIGDYDNTFSHSVKPMALQNKKFNIFNENRRRVMVIQTNPGALVALVFVGAIQVDSIRFNTGIKKGTKLEKGTDLGSFHFGGSTVMMFTDSHDLQFDADIIQNSKKKQEFQVRCGETIGKWININ